MENRRAFSRNSRRSRVTKQELRSPQPRPGSHLPDALPSSETCRGCWVMGSHFRNPAPSSWENMASERGTGFPPLLPTPQPPNTGCRVGSLGAGRPGHPGRQQVEKMNHGPPPFPRRRMQVPRGFKASWGPTAHPGSQTSVSSLRWATLPQAFLEAFLHLPRDPWSLAADPSLTATSPCLIFLGLLATLSPHLGGVWGCVYVSLFSDLLPRGQLQGRQEHLMSILFRAFPCT